MGPSMTGASAFHRLALWVTSLQRHEASVIICFAAEESGTEITRSLPLFFLMENLLVLYTFPHIPEVPVPVPEDMLCNLGMLGDAETGCALGKSKRDLFLTPFFPAHHHLYRFLHSLSFQKWQSMSTSRGVHFLFFLTGHRVGGWKGWGRRKEGAC